MAVSKGKKPTKSKVGKVAAEVEPRDETAVKLLLLKVEGLQGKVEWLEGKMGSLMDDVKGAIKTLSAETERVEKLSNKTRTESEQILANSRKTATGWQKAGEEMEKTVRVLHRMVKWLADVTHQNQAEVEKALASTVEVQEAVEPPTKVVERPQKHIKHHKRHEERFTNPALAEGLKKKLEAEKVETPAE
jgi:hypothetical protein